MDKHISSFIILFLLFFLPLIFFPSKVTYFEQPKVIAAEIAIELLFILTLFGKNVIRIKKPDKISLSAFVLIFLLSLIHLIFLPTLISFFGNSFRLQGIFLLWHLLIFSLISSESSFAEINPLIFPFSVIMLLISSILIGTNETGRFIGTLGEPNSLAASVIFLWPWIYFIKSKNKRTYFIQIFSIIVSLIIIFLSGSRSGIIAFFIQLLFIIFIRKFHFSIKRTVAVCLSFILVSLTLPFMEKNAWENRSTVWQTALYAGWNNPVLGGGFGNTEYLIKDTAIHLNNNLQSVIVDSSHNIFLDWWVQGGIIGLSIFIFLIIQKLRYFILRNKTLEITIFLGLLTVMSFNPVSVVTLLSFWYLLGQRYQPELDQLDRTSS